MIDIAQIYEQTDAEFEAQKQPMFEGEGGFGSFEEMGVSAHLKGTEDSVRLMHPRRLILSFLSQN